MTAGEASRTDDFFVAGGTVPPGSPSYVERSADRELREALLSGEYCYVLNSRQMGKSSLAVRTVQHLQAKGIRTAFVDLTRIGGATVSVEQWYTGILVETGRALGLRSESVAYVRDHKELSPTQRYLTFLQDVALPAADSPLVVMIDEIDATRGLSFSTDEFFTGIRQMHNARAADPALNRLTFCLLGAALPGDLIRDPRTTPFNIGRMIDLRDFTLENAQPFADALGPNGAQRLTRVMHWTAGHPYLTQVLCAELAKDLSLDVDTAVSERYLSPRASENDTNLVDVGNRLLAKGDPNVDDRGRADILSLYDQMLRHQELPDDEANAAIARIKMSGIARSLNGKLSLRNAIYAQAFNRKWVRENMPGQEFKRQKRAYWLGVLRTGALSAVILSIIGYLAASNYRLANQFERQRDDARYEEYVTSMVDANAIAEQHDMDRLQESIDLMDSSPYKGWEWHYWNRLAHSALMSIKLPDDGFRDGPMAVSKDGHLAVALNRSGGVLAIATLDDHPTVKRVQITRTERPDVEICDQTKQIVIFGRSGRLILVDSATAEVLSDHTTAGVQWMGGELAIRRGHILGLKGSELVDYEMQTHVLKQLGSISEASIGSMDISSDGQFVFCQEGPVGAPQNSLVFYDRKTWSIVGRLENIVDGCRPAWSTTENRIAVAWSEEGTDSPSLGLYDIKLRKMVGSRFVRRTELGRLSFSQDGTKLLVSGLLNTARLYDPEHLDAPAIATIPESFRGFSELLGNGDKVLTKSWNLRIYDLSSFLSETVRTTWGETPQISGDGRVWAANPSRAAVANVLKPTERASLRNTSDHQPELSDEENTVWLRSAGKEKRLQLVDANGAILLDLPAVPGDGSTDRYGAKTFARSLDGATVAIPRANRKYEIYRMEDRRLLQTITMEGQPTLAEFSNDGRHLFLADDSGLCVLIDIRETRTTWRQKDSAAAISDAASFSPDGRKIAVARWDEKATIIDVQTGRVIGRPLKCSEPLKSIAWTKDGKRVATGGLDGALLIWDSETQRQLTVLQASGPEICEIRFIENGATLATADQSGSARLWRTDQSP